LDPSIVGDEGGKKNEDHERRFCGHIEIIAGCQKEDPPETIRDGEVDHHHNDEKKYKLEGIK